MGPFFHRELFGFSFYDPDPSNNNNNAILRAKWSGRLMENLYCNPADATCTPPPISDSSSVGLSGSVRVGVSLSESVSVMVCVVMFFRALLE